MGPEAGLEVIKWAFSLFCKSESEATCEESTGFTLLSDCFVSLPKAKPTSSAKIYVLPTDSGKKRTKEKGKKTNQKHLRLF